MQITERLLPKGRAYGRPGYPMKPTSITVHNTANEGADAEAHAKFLEGGQGVSWHYTVDADSIIHHLPDDEQGWHAGSHEGNTTSIGVEVCEYPPTAEGAALQARAEVNAAWLVADLKRRHGISDVFPHKHWTGKNCPRDILPHWGAFMDAVNGQPKPAPHHDLPLLRKGSVGGAVFILQRELNAHAKSGLVVDGDFGKHTEDAVRAFQKRKKLVVDGVVGANTWKALGR